MITFFYTKSECIKKDTLKILGEEKKHIVSVLRYKEGDLIDVVDGIGNRYHVEITDIQKNEIQCRILSRKKGENEPKIHLTLAQSICKGYKMDWLVEKVTEVGVSSIIPLVTKHTVVKLGDSKKEKAKIERWKKIAIASMKQSLRSVLPEIKPAANVGQLLPQIRRFDLTLTGSLESNAKSLRDIRQLIKSSGKILAIVGPEAGFSEDEMAQLKSAGAVPVSLGGRRLRTETAGIILSSLVLHELGEEDSCAGGKR